MSVILNFSDLANIEQNMVIYQNMISENNYEEFIFNIDSLMEQDNYKDLIDLIHQKLNSTFCSIFLEEKLLFSTLMNPLYLGILDYSLKKEDYTKQEMLFQDFRFLKGLDFYASTISTPSSSNEEKISLFTRPKFIQPKYQLYKNMLKGNLANKCQALERWFNIFTPYIQKIAQRYKSPYKSEVLSEGMLEYLFDELVLEKESIFDYQFYIQEKQKVAYIVNYFNSYTKASFAGLDDIINNFMMFPDVYKYSSNPNEAYEQTRWIFNIIAPLVAPYWKNMNLHMGLALQVINLPLFLDVILDKNEEKLFIHTLFKKKALNLFLDNLSLLPRYDQALFYLLNHTKEKNLIPSKEYQLVVKKLPQTYSMLEKNKLDALSSEKNKEKQLSQSKRKI